MVSAHSREGGNIDSAFNQPIIPFPPYNTGGLASSLPFTCSTMYISGGYRGGVVGVRPPFWNENYIKFIKHSLNLSLPQIRVFYV